MKEDVLKEQSKKTNRSDEEILSLLQKEAPFFVKNNWDEIETETTLKCEPIEDASFLRGKIHAESESIIPNVRKEILKTTKAERPFKCWLRRNHPIALSIGVVLVTVLVSTTTLLSLRPWEKEDQSALVSLTITPASHKQSKGKMNPYTLSFSFRVETNGNVNPSSLKANNYSALLVKKSTPFINTLCTSDVSFATSLLRPAYNMGYLENDDPSAPNEIKINYFTLQKDRVSKKEKEYEAAFNRALKRAEKGLGVYASLQFEDGCHNMDLSTFQKLDESTREAIIDVYSSLKTKDGESLLDIRHLLETRSDILPTMVDTLSSIKEAKLSPLTLDGVLRATASMCKSAKEESHDSESLFIEEKKKEIIETVDSLPISDEKQKSKMKELLQKDAYYLVELSEENEKKLDGAFYSCFRDIRESIKRNLNENSFKSLLQDGKQIAESDITFFDAAPLIQGETPIDSGNHRNDNNALVSQEGGIVLN
mgnify:CR=1 FL=1